MASLDGCPPPFGRTESSNDGARGTIRWLCHEGIEFDLERRVAHPSTRRFSRLG
jgi:hypothetical protein